MIEHPVFHEIIGSTQLMNVATVDEAVPWIATVFFIWHQEQFCFVSSERSRHIQAATQQPQVAATIQPEPENWAAICGLQIAGKQVEVTGVAQAKLLARYLARYPFVAANAMLSEKIKQSHFYAIQPQSIYLIDNRRGFAQRQQLR